MLTPFSALTGVAAGGAILAAGGSSLHVCLLALIGGAVFADIMRRAGKEAAGRDARDPTDVATPLAFLAILMAAAFDVGCVADDPPATVAWMLRVLGTGVILAGVLLRSSAARALGDAFVVRLGISAKQRLVEAGPYSRLRHPNYAALLLIALGTSVALASPLAFAATMLLWLPIIVVRITREERMLAARFGAAWQRYRGRTWRLVPGMY